MTKIFKLIRQFVTFSRIMGWRYTQFRVVYELKKKLGYFVYKFPTKPLSNKLSYVDLWETCKDFYGVFSSLKDQDKRSKEASSLRKLLAGNRFYFNWKWYNSDELGDWTNNPITGKNYPLIHWSRINQMDPDIGDIKFVWEKSKFFHFQIYVNSVTHENHDEIVEAGLTEMLDWIGGNPRNIGPNWCCSQEISLRLINWTIFIQKFKKQLLLNNRSELAIILRSIEEQIIHVYKNINFSKIAVRNNHAFSECLGLFVIYSIFPFFAHAEKRALFGHENFIEEVAFQIFPDGTDSQYSTNYFRNKLQLITLFIACSLDFEYPIPEVVLDRASKSIQFFRSIISVSGDVSNFGLNDGSLPFKFDETVHFRNYNHQVDTLSLALKIDTFSSSNDYALFFNGIKNTINLKPINRLENKGVIEYKGAGYIVVNEADIKLLIRAGNYKSRPGQSDNMHVDLWYKGENLLCDSGSFSYNTKEKEVEAYFLSTRSNNTITINDEDHMQKGSNFIWTSIVDYPLINCKETGEGFEIVIELEAYKYYEYPLRIKRSVVLNTSKKELIVEDSILNPQERQSYDLKQHWHLLPHSFEKIKMESDGKLIKNKGYVSLFYSKLDPVICTDFISNNNSIKTRFKF